MSFFDDVEEPAPRRAVAARTRRPTRGGRSSGAQRKFLIRRAVLAVVVLIAAILVVLGVHSCQVSARTSALRDYDNSVASLIQRSDQTGRALFSELSGASGTSNQTGLQTQINQTKAEALAQLKDARGLSVPSQMQMAQQQLLLALQMRSDAVSKIAQELQPALATSAAGGAVSSIAQQMSRLYASDVIYNDYAAPAIANALTAQNISVGGLNGQPIAHGHFVPSSQWLQTSFVAAQLGSVATSAKNHGKPAPGIHGHRMDTVTVNGTQLTPGGSATLSASPPPTFVCTFTNDGQNAETDVVVKVTVQGTSITGHAVVARTLPGQNYTANVTLDSSPPAGTYTVSATVERVPGETVLLHNTQTFSITFTG